MYRAISLTSRFSLVCGTFRDVKAFSSSASVYGLGSDVALKESYCHGASDKPLMGKTIGVALQETVEKFPDRDAFVYRAEGSRYTYRQLLDEVDCLAAGLTATGIRKGDRVGMWGPNSREWILTQYACARIGAILVNVNPAYRVEETVHTLRTGTTGHPKGAMLTHHGLLNNSYYIGQHSGYCDERAVAACPLPLYHVAGTVLGSLSVIVHGATCVFPSPSFEPQILLTSIQDEKCTVLLGVPTIYIDTLNHPDFYKYDISSLRICGIGAAPCPEEVLKLAQSKLNLTPLVGYGMTEAGPILTSTDHGDPPEVTLNTAGKPLHHIEVKVIDPQTKKILPVNECGEVCMRSYCNAKGYWNDPEKTKEAIIDGWMHSGDLGKMDEKGNISIVGRIKDIIIRGGVNIFPAEIEDFLYQHPKVETVQIVGVPDERMGEEVCACIKLKQEETSSAEEIKAFCQGKISHFKIPRYVEFVENFPMTVSLKVKKFALRDIMAKKFGLYKK